ncbi:MAG: hypothetical protein EOO92_07745, partial [Pedobacter sp.]
MTKKSPILLSVLFLLLSVVSCTQAQTAKTTLNLSGLLLPANEQTSLFFVIGLQPEIVAVAKIPVEVDMKGVTAATSTLGKGKLLLIGSDAYYRSGLLQHRQVQTFIKNSVDWAVGSAKKNPSIAVDASTGKQLNTFLSKGSSKVYTTADFKLNAGTDILFLTRDVTDTTELERIEKFIRAGGTLIFGSPYFSINKKHEKKEGVPPPSLAINDLFAKAGLINPNFLIIRTNNNKYM